MDLLSKKINSLSESETIEMAKKARELKDKGIDIISLSLGEPDFDTPDHIKEAAKRALDEGFTKYTPVSGYLELRQAISDKFKRDNNLDYNTNQIVVSTGAKQSLANTMLCLLDEGDEVIVCAPYWVSYPDMVLLAGGVPVVIEAGLEQRFKISAAQLEAAITNKTKLFVINSPSNPTGIAYSRDELKALADVLLKHPQVLVATDDMYEHILWTEEPFVNILNVCPELY